MQTVQVDRSNFTRFVSRAVKGHSYFNFTLDAVSENWLLWGVTIIIGALACVRYFRYGIVTVARAKVQIIDSGSKPFKKFVELAKREVSLLERQGIFHEPDIIVTKILVYPIKSCRGTSVMQAYCDEEGLKYDRKFAIIDAATHKVITARQKHHMVLIHPLIEEDQTHLDGGRLVISFPGNSECETFSIPLNPQAETLKDWDLINDIELWGQSDIDGYVCQSCSPSGRNTPSEIISRYLNHPVFLVMKGPRARACPRTIAFPKLDASTAYADGFPLLIASEESLEAVKAKVRESVGVKPGVAEKWREEELVIERFRPNIVLRGSGIPWAEDTWRTISIIKSDLHPSDDRNLFLDIPISLVSPCARCLLPNIDTKTGIRDAAVPYKVLMGFRTRIDPERMNKACFGCNGVPSGAGVVNVGDKVRVMERFE